MNIDFEFSNILHLILSQGKEITTRNSKVLRYRNITLDFHETPLVSTRRTAWKNALREMEWFLSGSNNINDLHPNVRHWWAPWANPEGYIFNNYSQQLRRFCGVRNVNFDQVDYLIDAIIQHPYSRRQVITTWNTADMAASNTPITNCHGTVIQTFVEPDNSLHMTMYQRSADVVLGLPHNLIQYWAFLIYLAHQGGKKVGSFTWIGGDCHIYKDHVETAKKMVDLTHKQCKWPDKPYQLIYTPTSDQFLASDFSLNQEYKPILDKPLKMTV